MEYSLVVWPLIAAYYAFWNSKGKEGLKEYWCPFVTGACGLVVGLSNLGLWIFN